MKLKKINVYLVTLKLRFPFTTSFGTYQILEHPFIEIIDGEGRKGYGEIPTLPDPAYKPESDHFSILTSLEKFVIPAVIESHNQKGFKDVEDLKKSYAHIKGANFAKSGIEAAFWDLLAQDKNLPLWKLWGGKNKNITVGVSIGGKTEEEVIKRAEQALNQGYKRLKIKVWPGFENKVVNALRKKYPKTLIQIDANSSYDLENWKLLKKVDGYDLLLIEQPLFDDDVIYHSEISKSLKTPVCLDESIHSLEDAKRAIFLWQKNKNLKRLIINIKPPRVSGFSEAIEIAKFCASKRVKTWVGGMLDSGWGKAFNLNLNSLEEVNLPGDHFSPTGEYFEEDIIESPLISNDGQYTLTNEISVGVKIDHRRFKKLSTLVSSHKI